MEKLAILGGRPVLAEPLPATNTIDLAEKQAVQRVLETGVLSDYLGRAGNKFLGGREVLAFEEAMKEKFNVKYAVSFNSATTALDAAISAAGIGPGDEVIVSPFTMSASATAILMNMAIPIFADIEPDTFCLDPKSIMQKISDKTKAIMLPNIFGGSPRMDEILAICKKHNLKLIEDNAQSPGATYKKKFLGTVGDMGVFSFNCHKVIQCGEGGVLVTNDGHLAFRAQLRRNHGEQVLDDMADATDFVLGSNYRLSEIHAAIAHEQLKKLDFLNENRIRLANHLTRQLQSIPGITPTFVLPETKHVYYVYPIRFDGERFGVSRQVFAKAMDKEGFPLNQGYLKPIYLLNMFQNTKMFPRTHCPWMCKAYDKQIEYRKGDCPVTEKMYEEEFLFTTITRYPLTVNHIDLFVSAVKKIHQSAEELNKAQGYTSANTLEK